MAETIPFEEIGDVANVIRDDNSSVTFETVEQGRRIRLDDNIDFADTFEVPTDKRTEGARKGGIGFFESLNRAGVGSLVPFVNPEKAAKLVNVMSAVNRLKDDQYGDNEIQKKSDLETFKLFGEALAEEQARGYSTMGQIGTGVAALPAFMVEMFATGGIATGVKQAAQKALVAAAGKVAANRAVSLGIRAAGTAAGAVARTPFASSGRIWEQYTERQINTHLTFTDEGVEFSKEAIEQPYTSFLKAAGDSIIENFSEATGGAIGRALGKTTHIINRKLGGALTQLWQKMHPNESVQKIFTRAGYNGFIAELGEERVGDLLRAVTGVDDFGAGDNASVLDKIVASIPSGEQWLVEAGILAVPGAAHLGWQHAVTQLQKRNNTTPDKNAYLQTVEGDVLTPEQVETLTVEKPKEGEEAQAQAQETPGDLGVGEFKPVEKSTRPSFAQRAQDIMGKEVTREEVMSGIQDVKVKTKLANLDEQALALDQTLSYLEKRRTTMAKNKKTNPIDLATIDKIIEEQQRQFDVIDSERGDILTSVQKNINLENEKLGLTGKQLTDVGLQRQMRGFKQGVEAGRDITKQMFVEAKAGLREFLKSTEMNPNERGRFLSQKQIEAIDTPQKLANKIADIADRVDDIVNQRKAKELKGKIKDVLSGTKPTTEAGRPIGKYTPEIQVILDKAREISELTKGDAVLRLQANQVASGDDVPTDEVRLENYLLDTMAGLNQRNPQQLSIILNELEGLISTGRAESLLRSFSRKDKQLEDKTKGLAVLTGGAALDEVSKDSLLKKLDRRFRTMGKTISSNWDNILDQISSYDKSSKSEQSFLSKRFGVVKIEIAERQAVANLIQDMVVKGQEIFGLKSEYQFAKKMHADLAEEVSAVFIHSDGVTRRVTLSRSQLRKRWMELRDPTLVKAIAHPEANRYTQEIVDWIDANMSQEDKEFAEAQLRFYRDYYVIINDVYRRQTGVNLPFNELYSPTRRAHQLESIENPLKQEADDYGAFIPGSLKTRVTNTRPLLDMNDWEVLQRHVIQMEHYRHWADTLRDMSAFFNDGDVRRTIEKQFGSDINNIIDSFIKDFRRNGRRKVESWERAVDAIRNGKVIFALGGKLAQVPKQLTGIFGYMEFVTPMEWADGMVDFVKNAPTAIKTLSNSPLIQLMDGNITQEFVGLMSSEDAKNFMNRPSIKNAVNLWMMGVRYGTKAANIIGGWPVYKATLDKTGSAEQAMDAFEAAIVKTQPTKITSSLSQWQRGNALQRLTSMFMSAQNRYFQRELLTIRNAVYGRASAADLAKIIAIHHFIIPSLFQYIADGFQWEDEEQVRAMLTGPLNGVFILGDMLDAVIRVALNETVNKDSDYKLSTFSEGNPLFDPINGVKDAIKKIEYDDIELEAVAEAMKTLAVSSIGPVTGLPTKLIFDVIPQGISDITDGEVGKGVLKLGGWAPAHIDKIYDR